MKGKGYRPRSEVQLSVNEQVRVEMQIFLKALDSYSARVAIDPEITFEQHCTSLMELTPTARFRAQRNRLQRN